MFEMSAQELGKRLLGGVEEMDLDEVRDHNRLFIFAAVIPELT